MSRLMKMNVQEIVDFENPPLVEVVCGVRFQPLEKFATPHIGLLWQNYKKDYLYYKEQAPIAVNSEPQILQRPPLPRIWFTDENESRIIQVQRDRFVTNWKKVEPEQTYPHFGEILEKFEADFTKFTDFLTDSELDSPSLLECELTYINIIPKGQGWNDWSNLARLSPAIGWNWSQQNILPIPEGINLNTVCFLPDNLGSFQLNLASLKRVPENEEALQLLFSLKKTSSELTCENMLKWFVVAHDWLVKSFLSLTSPEVQKEHWKICPEQHKKKRQTS
jgi:uncharacterized protein (TIGR04255 family)